MNKKVMNQIVKIVSKNQNDKLKLNSGQIREMIKLIFDSLYELDLTVVDAVKKEKPVAKITK